MRVDVTWDHIRAGEKESNDSCAVALAVVDAADVDHGSVWVDSNQIVIGPRTYLPPLPVVQFIERFDMGWQVAPFSFELPDEPYRGPAPDRAAHPGTDPEPGAGGDKDEPDPPPSDDADEWDAYYEVGGEG